MTDQRAEDLAWLRSVLRLEKANGHCGESTSETIQRQRRNERIDRLLALIEGHPQ